MKLDSAAFVIGLSAAIAAFPAEPAAPVAAPPDPVAVQVSDWHGYPKQSFALSGQAAHIVLPQVPAPGRPWVWRTSLPDDGLAVDQELARCGYHVGHSVIPEALDTAAALDLMDRFYHQARAQWGLAEKPALDPFSAGGLAAQRYATEHPERIAGPSGSAINGVGAPVPQPGVFGAVRAIMWSADVLPTNREYYQLRHGLGNCRARFTQAKTGRVVFLGGSITHNGGWRDELMRYLQQRFPETSFDFIAAGIPSLGSNAHAFRLEQDVLNRGPVDLLFVEAAVNDATNIPDQPALMLRAMEGLVRHLRTANPLTDIVALHFVTPEAVGVYDAGGIPVPEAQHERVAEHYGCPSLNLSLEVAERIKAGQFTWASGFNDVHPPPYGQRLYANSMARMLDAAFARATPPQAQALPEHPLDPYSYSQGHFGTLAAATLGQGFTLDPVWRPLRPADTREGFVNVPALTAAAPGAELTYAFSGSLIGLLLAAGPDSCVLEFSIDAAPYARVDTFSPWSGVLYLPWPIVLADTLSPGPHTLSVRTTAQAEDRTGLHIIQILLN